ncbi:MAG: hypothetical protein COA32_09715 [Fluviicola sp.]|nr:MAG: hypothetical protein COA32_09715 [Fluviicola sp.]
MKARRSNRKITPFGGAIPVLKQIKSFKIAEQIRECLGTRVKQAKYGYDDVIISWMLTNLCGGFRLDHITKLRKNLDIIPGLKLPSHDTLGRVMKSLATDVLKESGVHRSKRGYREAMRKGSKTYKRVTHRETNDNEQMNILLASITSKIGLLNKNKKYDLDLDATTIYTEVREAKKNKNKEKCFAPMVACIDNLPVYIEMRNGNVAPGARILESTQKCIENLEKNEISIGRVRMDRGAYHGPTFDYLHKNGIHFVVGARKSKKLMETLNTDDSNVWNKVYIQTSLYDWDCETTDLEWKISGSNETYRLIVLRMDRKRDTVRKGQYGTTPMTWIYGGQYAYKLIITNDWNSSAKELVEFYNQRGTSERNFDTMKNDFGWKLPPFSNMNENTVFLIIAAITNNVYQALIGKLKKKVKEIRLNARLRDFIYVFMSVACELTETEYVFYDTDIAYEKIC